MATSASMPLSTNEQQQEPTKRIKPAIPVKPKFIPPISTPTSINRLNQQQLAALVRSTGQQLNQQLVLQSSHGPHQQIMSNSDAAHRSIETAAQMPLRDLHNSQNHIVEITDEQPYGKQSKNNSNRNHNQRGVHNTWIESVSESFISNADVKSERKLAKTSSSMSTNRLLESNEQVDRKDNHIDGHCVHQSPIPLSPGRKKSQRPSVMAAVSIKSNEANESQSHHRPVHIQSIDFPRDTTDNTSGTAILSHHPPFSKFNADWNSDRSNHKQQLEQVLAQQQRLYGENGKENSSSRLKILLGKKQRSTSNSLDGSKFGASTNTSGHMPISSTVSTSDLNLIGCKNRQNHSIYNEMKQNCCPIQEKHLIEKRWPQESNQPVDVQHPEEQVMLIFELLFFSHSTVYILLLEAQCSRTTFFKLSSKYSILMSTIWHLYSTVE